MNTDALDTLAKMEAAGLRLIALWGIRDDGSCECRRCLPDDGKRGKHPIEAGPMQGGFRTRELAEIRSRHPGCNVGIATGKPSGVWVLDLDGADGESWLAGQEKVHGPLPITPQVKTGRGRHLYFRLPADVEIRNRVKAAPHVDVRSTGGLVVAPPSRHHSRANYRWTVAPWDVPFADAPGWLLALVSARGPQQAVKTPEPEHTGPLTEENCRYIEGALASAVARIAAADEGTRNDTLNREAFSVGGLVAHLPEEAHEIAAEALERAGIDAGLPTHEAADVARRGLRDGINRPRELPKPRGRTSIAGERLAKWVSRRVDGLAAEIRKSKQDRRDTAERCTRRAGELLAIPGLTLDPLPAQRKLIDAATAPGACRMTPADAQSLIPTWIQAGRVTPASVPLGYEHIPGSEDWTCESVCYVAECDRYIRRRNGRWDVASMFTREATARLLASEDGMSPGAAHAMLSAGTHPVVRSMEVLCDSRELVLTKDGSLVLNSNPQRQVDPRPGDWNTIRDVLACQVGEENMEWLLNWAAWCVQNPERRPRVAVVIRGPQGTGKTESGKLVGYARGAWIEIGHMEATSKFNSAWAGAPFILASDIVIGDDRTTEGQRLKRYITDETVPRAVKFGSEAPVKNRSVWWITSNEQNPVPVEQGDRRYAVFESRMPPPEVKARWDASFADYPDERRAEWPELRAFVHYLRNRPLDVAMVTRLPQTAARVAMQRLGMNSAQRFQADVDADGYLNVVRRCSPGENPAEIDATTGHVSTRHLYGTYRGWCLAEGLQPLSQDKFAGLVTWPRGTSQRRFGPDLKLRYRILPRLKDEEPANAAA
jgi:hypothetical protein